ncbi:hypothetical protein SA2016_2984 [Sinomonas atrocyanea]|uniref:Glycosyltransferase RgtA/B/C/D-like domain-containing protein n=2 Tax=Sinomonas atrocyanea TaxID=37927 RepID=A0A127A2I5_9MICC|nr:hypothetical protein SA2016_2984 [Sinomonas atrocyanea]GEB63319.1 hypothetical protein SAT01_07670 [Sinomonas atrocyanea]GGG53273.1 hypothetical protein GCM10007172_00520 [Sinomonas atrocyanea]
MISLTWPKPRGAVGVRTEGPSRAAVRGGVAECIGLMVAVAFALLTVWHIDATDRSSMLYYDGDSVLPALVRGSIQSGQPQDWALSAVLFIPEMGLYFALSALGLGIKATFALNAAVNLTLFYGVLRFVSGVVQHDRPRVHRVVGALAAFGTATGLALLEDSPGRNTFELASLLATTTYYSMTLLASVATTGLAARLVAPGARSRWRWLELALVGVGALSSLTNPLFLAWEVLPVAVVLGLIAWRRVISWRRFAFVGVLLAAGSGLGLLARILFASLILKDGPSYAKPGVAGLTAIFYPVMLAERASTIAGAVWLTLIVSLILISAIVFRRSLAVRDAGAALISGLGWVAPLAVLGGVVVLGQFWIRYLQPMYFAPVCTLVLAPRLFAHGSALIRRLPKGTVKGLLVGVVVACLGASAAATVALSRSTAVVDPDVRCVGTWVSASHEIGAGRFWAIRAPKAFLPEPGQLVQVDSHFGEYPWLTDRADYSSVRVSFVLTDSEATQFVLPPVAQTAPSSTIRCGRYTITDFGSPILPIGPATPDAIP